MRQRTRVLDRFDVVGRRTGDRHTVIHTVVDVAITLLSGTSSWKQTTESLDTSDGMPVNSEDGQLTLASTGEPLDRA